LYDVFVDKKSKEKLGPKTGCNQTGIFVSHSEIIFVRKRKVQKINVDELKGTKVANSQSCGWFPIKKYCSLF